MINNYPKEEILQIAEYLVEELRELEDGTSTTTAKLAADCGYDDMDMSELFELDKALFKAARKNHIKLDSSPHKGLEEGLPYNLDFIVKNKRAQIKCPFCGSTNTARYIYGYPLFSERMEKKLNDGKWILGGCCMYTVEINGQIVNMKPKRKCNKCKKDFGKPPVLIHKKNDTAEDYRDIVTSIKFEIGEYRSEQYNVTIKKNKNGALVKSDRILFMPRPIDNPDNIQISDEKWNKIINSLFSELHLHEWKKQYDDHEVDDGTYWSLEIGLKKKGLAYIAEAMLIRRIGMNF